MKGMSKCLRCGQVLAVKASDVAAGTTEGLIIEFMDETRTKVKGMSHGSPDYCIKMLREENWRLNAALDHAHAAITTKKGKRQLNYLAGRKESA